MIDATDLKAGVAALLCTAGMGLAQDGIALVYETSFDAGGEGSL